MAEVMVEEMDHEVVDHEGVPKDWNHITQTRTTKDTHTTSKTQSENTKHHQSSDTH